MDPGDALWAGQEIQPSRCSASCWVGGCDWDQPRPGVSVCWVQSGHWWGQWWTSVSFIIPRILKTGRCPWVYGMREPGVSPLPYTCSLIHLDTWLHTDGREVRKNLSSSNDKPATYLWLSMSSGENEGVWLRVLWLPYSSKCFMAPGFFSDWFFQAISYWQSQGQWWALKRDR